MSGDVPTPAISDPADVRLDDFRHLTAPDRRQRVEAALGICVAEGPLAVERLVGAGLRPRSVVVTPARWSAMAAALDAVSDRVSVAEPEILAAAAGYDVHRGVLASFDRPAPRTAEEVVAAGPLVAVVEAVNDFENLGAIFRNAAAFGVSGVLLDPHCCDPWYRRCIRVSIGHSLLLPWARLDPWPGSLTGLRDHGFEVLALTPAADAETIGTVVEGLAPGTKVAALVGAEGPGLSPAAMAASTRRVQIPMAGGADSVNVATAAAIAFHRLSGHRSSGT